MRYLKIILITYLFFLGNSNFLKAQTKLPIAFSELLEQMKLDIAIPVERTYKNKRIKRNEFFNPDHIIRARRRRVEIQYKAFPKEIHPHLIPHIRHTMTVTSIASNFEKSATVAVHKISKEDLANSYKADWGSISYFQPKRSFSKYQHGKLLSLFKEDQGMICILFLFDEGEEPEVDRQVLAARFR